MTPDERRRALAFNAIGPAINKAGYWLPLSARKAVAEAVLEAIKEPDADNDLDWTRRMLLEAQAEATTEATRADHAEAALARFKDQVQAIADEARGGIRQQLGDALAALDEPKEPRP